MSPALNSCWVIAVHSFEEAGRRMFSSGDHPLGISRQGRQRPVLQVVELEVAEFGAWQLLEQCRT